MYPAEDLDVIYKLDDLPESLTIVSTDLGYTIPNMQFTNSLPNIYEGELDGELAILRTRPLAGGAPVWELEGADGGGAQDWVGEVCLFYDDSATSPSWPRIYPDNRAFAVDHFKDSYTATSINGPTLTMVRESLCIWRSRNASGNVDNSLYYDTKANEQNLANNGGVLGRILWRFNGVYRTDAGPYNSPEGVYGDTWTVV
jgi:hypothetical protein